MVNKKVILGILTIGMLATVAGAGTWAYFQASVDATGNTITAGGLSVGMTETVGVDIPAFAQPGDSNIILDTVNIHNSGNINGQLTASIKGSGDLASYVRITLHDITDTNNENDKVLWDGTNAHEVILVQDLAPTTDTAKTYQILYSFPDSGDQSDAMSDTFTGTVSFNLYQGTGKLTE